MQSTRSLPWSTSASPPIGKRRELQRPLIDAVSPPDHTAASERLALVAPCFAACTATMTSSPNRSGTFRRCDQLLCHLFGDLEPTRAQAIKLVRYFPETQRCLPGSRGSLSATAISTGSLS